MRCNIYIYIYIYDYLHASCLCVDVIVASFLHAAFLITCMNRRQLYAENSAT